MKFTEDDKSKTNQGGLNSKGHKPRVLRAYGSTKPGRNIVDIYEKYVSLCPTDPKNNSLYKYSMSNAKHTAAQWFSDRPVGVNMLKKVIPSLARRAGLSGKYTNHSLRATCATRMFQAGVDEQLIKTFTGHCSDAVHDKSALQMPC